MSKFYVGHASYLRCRASLDLEAPDTFSGRSTTRGKPQSYTGVVETIDPSASSAPGREWRVIVRDTSTTSLQQR
jgi:hypothetical protein